jgi:hypothetical protein
MGANPIALMLSKPENETGENIIYPIIRLFCSAIIEIG